MKNLLLRTFDGWPYYEIEDRRTPLTSHVFPVYLFATGNALLEQWYLLPSGSDGALSAALSDWLEENRDYLIAYHHDTDQAAAGENLDRCILFLKRRADGWTGNSVFNQTV